MKIISLLIFSAFANISFAQDTTYFNSNWKELESFSNASYYHILFRDSSNNEKVQKFLYHTTGRLISEQNYSNYADRILEGKNVWYFINGNLHGERTYLKDEINGVFKTYWFNGNVKRNDYFENGKWISGTCYNENGKKIKYYKYESSAIFPGELEGLMKYLVKELRYPEAAINDDVEGRVMVRFTIDKFGYVSKPKILVSISPELDAEALRVVGNMPKWKPGMRDGEYVDTFFELPVKFKLE
ncbi:MAG: TonB family protein [Crocinitomicaceae bacterium]|nr:TonB family protein [Crocinitomicaceae bacterium]